MTTPSGTIGLSDVNAELGYSPSANITMNDSAVRTLAGAGGAGTIITMNQLRGKSNRVTISLTLTSNTTNYDVYSNRGPTYDPGKSDITVTINPGVVVYSTSTGSSALSVPSSFNPEDTVTIINNGVVLGKGGNGGNGAWYGGLNNTAGAAGGPALYVARPVVFTNNDRIAGGGGGGGGGIGSTQIIGPDTPQLQSGGGGGGGGVGQGSGGTGGQAYPPEPARNGTPGQDGSLTAGGAGGSTTAGTTYPRPPGGPGGGYGSAGSPTPPGPGLGPSAYQPGGASGAAVTGNPYITWPATGTRNGPIS